MSSKLGDSFGDAGLVGGDGTVGGAGLGGAGLGGACLVGADLRFADLGAMILDMIDLS